MAGSPGRVPRHPLSSILFPRFLLRLLLPSLIAATPTTSPTDFRTRGLALLATIDHRFSLPHDLYTERLPSDSKPPVPAMIWSAGVQLSALNAAARLDPSHTPRALAYVAALDSYRGRINNTLAYYPSPSHAPSADAYFDDNEWLVLALLETYDLTHDPSCLTRARETMSFVLTGESPDFAGGLWWRTRRDSKNTCSNAPAICAALALHQITHDDQLLAFAQRTYAWTNAHLRDPADSLYFDHLRPDGSLEKTKWSYNTALMIRASCLFYQTTHDATYLAEARRLARAAESHFFRPADGACTDDASFAHLLCESLLFVSDLDHDPSHLAHVTRALTYLSTLERDGLYPKRWGTLPASATPQLMLRHQASAARAFLTAARYQYNPPRQ